MIGGLVAGGGAGRGALAGFLVGIFGGIILWVLLIILGGAVGGILGARRYDPNIGCNLVKYSQGCSHSDRWTSRRSDSKIDRVSLFI